ncbi:F-box protein CPR30-like [Chenopodium quinoa]|uniref:F-box protein CPR30-like n=1 Tax=Chenopodium quinoa TaxID=63459 RepID=UPI000B789527|nr:F-box protein CPR30-like [Chenopodium quinoa]
MEDINGDGKRAREDAEERYFPDELITQEILPWLPIKSLTRCKLVSKEWNSTISEPNYILDHFNKSVFSDPFTPVEYLFIQSGDFFFLFHCNIDENTDDDENVDDGENVDNDENVDDGENDEVGEENLVELNVNFDYEDLEFEGDEIELVGSSNGLICLSGKIGRYFYLYNPKTNQSHKFYPGDFDYWKSYGPKPLTVWGFGYVSSVDDYKVVRIIPHFNGEVNMVHIYSLRSNIWSKLEWVFEERVLITGQPKLANETLYWIVGRGQILAFDLARETFEFFPHLGIIDRSSSALCVMGGCLSKFSSMSLGGVLIEIMKHPGKLVPVRFPYSLNLRDIKQLIGFTKTGEVFFTHSNPGMLGWLDLWSMETHVTLDDRLFLVESYVPTERSPHPAAELPNEPAEGTWPIYPQLPHIMILEADI